MPMEDINYKLVPMPVPPSSSRKVLAEKMVKEFLSSGEASAEIVFPEARDAVKMVMYLRRLALTPGATFSVATRRNQSRVFLIRQQKAGDSHD